MKRDTWNRYGLVGGGNEYGQGPTGRAIRQEIPQIVEDLLHDPQYGPWRKQALQCGFASSIALPFKKNGEVMGVLNIYAKNTYCFDEEEVSLLQELADDLAYGIINLRVYEKQINSTRQLKDSLVETIRAIALTVEKRDPYTAGHQNRVAELCVAIGREMGMDEDLLEGLGLGASIHDIGKIYVPAEILNRPGKLTGPEFEIIKGHVRIGYDIVKDIKFPWPIAEMILQHHERLDGSGYPDGLKGDQIILTSRILAVADTVEAISSHRPYRPGLGIDVALADIEENRSIKFDEEVVDVCLRLFREKGFRFSE